MHLHGALTRLQHPREDAQQRRLAAAVATDDSQCFAATHFEIDSAECTLLVIELSLAIIALPA